MLREVSWIPPAAAASFTSLTRLLRHLRGCGRGETEEPGEAANGPPAAGADPDPPAASSPKRSREQPRGSLAAGERGHTPGPSTPEVTCAEGRSELPENPQPHALTHLKRSERKRLKT